MTQQLAPVTPVEERVAIHLADKDGWIIDEDSWGKAPTSLRAEYVGLARKVLALVHEDEPAKAQVGIALHAKPVYKLVCSNEACTSDDYTALDTDGYTHYFDSQRDARDWGEVNGWDTSPAAATLCPACAAEARDAREQTEEIAAAIADALGEV